MEEVLKQTTNQGVNRKIVSVNFFISSADAPPVIAAKIHGLV
jgi:hypothetical protein